MTFKAGTFETVGVLAGAYKGKRLEDRALLTHAIGVDGYGRRASKSLCGRIAEDRLADDASETLPTCPLCAERLPRALMKAAAS